MTKPTELTTLELISKLISFDTTSRESNLELITFIEDYLHGFGIATQRVLNEDGSKANLYATVGPADKSGIMLSGHTDVVPVDGQNWATDPFSVTEKDGKLYGRGTADMKSFIAIVLANVPAMAKRDLKIPFHFAFSYDEEIGCIGVRRLIEAITEMPIRPAMCIVGEPTDMRVIIGHKGKLSIRAHVRGHEAHSSLAPQGVNAVEYAAELIVRLGEIAQRMAKEGPFDELYDVPFTTVHTGVISGGTALNIVPRDCSFEFEFRHLSDVDPYKLMQEITDFARDTLEPRMHKVQPGTGFTFEEMSTIPALDLNGDEEVVNLAKALTGQNDHAKVAYGTEAGLFQTRAGIPTVICGPGRIAEAHKPDEFVSLEQIARCEDFVQRLIDHVCAR